jgi:hypothetical protein
MFTDLYIDGYGCSRRKRLQTASKKQEREHPKQACIIMHFADLLSRLLKGQRLVEVRLTSTCSPKEHFWVLDFDLRLGGFPVPGLSIK